MDVKYINPFIDSAIANIEKIIKIKIEKDSVSIKKIAGMGADISCVIGISGEMKGSAVISFPKLLALKGATALFMEELTDLDNNAIDALCELTNIIVGHARNSLVNDGLSLTISTPVAIKGGTAEISAPKGLLFVVTSLKTQFGHLTVSVSVRKE